MQDQQLTDAAGEDLNCWALVEIFGHTKVAGRITTRKFGVNMMLQVDVPKGAAEFSHSQLFSPAAIFSINPTSEEWCRRWAERSYNPSPLPYLPERLSVTAASESDGPDSDEDHDDEGNEL
jgi:hypothetical protein